MTHFLLRLQDQSTSRLLTSHQSNMLYYPSKPSPMNVKAVAAYDNCPQKDVASSQLSNNHLDESMKATFSYRPLSTSVHSILGMLLPKSVIPEGRPVTMVCPLLRRPVEPHTSNSDHSCLVFLIRHGEASHNVSEKIASQRAKQQAEAQGLSPEEVKERMEKARIAVLMDENFRDAQLTKQGREDAERARHQLTELVRHRALTMPSKVLVSPLTRTLETANIIFPDHDAICVREEIQERQTGKPCDCRRSATTLSSRRSFQRFHMEALRNPSSLDDDDAFNCDDDESSCEEQDDVSRFEISSSSRRCLSDSRSNRPHHMGPRTLSDPAEEDKASLRLRTQKLLGLLDEPSIAVVTHKGYLRELERGTLGQADAEEFDNGEIRVYRLFLKSNHVLDKAERVV